MEHKGEIMISYDKTESNKVFSGVFWSYMEQISAQVVSFIIGVVLARVLMPNCYGIISVVMIFINIANVFVTNGLGNALIQKKEADELDFSTVLYSNLILSFIIYVALFVMAPFVEEFYEMEELSRVIRVMGLRIPIASINSVQQAYVSRKMDFKKSFVATLGGTILSAILGIWMAYAGFGVWALVVQYMSNSIMNTIALFVATGWRPKLKFSYKRMKALFSYGGKILFASLMTSIYSEVQNMIIGKKYTDVDLAYSEKGRHFPKLVAANVNMSITKVMFPVLASHQDEQDKVKYFTRKSIRLEMFVLTPLLLGLAAMAEPVVEIVLTEKWMACVPFMQIMCLVYVFQPMQLGSIRAMNACGRSDLYFKLEVVKKIAGIIILLVTVFCFDGVLAIIIGSLIAEIVSAFVNIPINRRLYKYKYTEQFADILPPVLNSVIMVLVVYMIAQLSISLYMRAMLQIIGGAVTYVVIAIIFKMESMQYLLSLLGRLVGKYKKQ